MQQQQLPLVKLLEKINVHAVDAQHAYTFLQRKRDTYASSESVSDGKLRSPANKKKKDGFAKISDNDSSVKIVSSSQKKPKVEVEEMENNAMRNTRTFLKHHVNDFYSFNHRPVDAVTIPLGCNMWFNTVNNNRSTISSRIFKSDFIDLLPALGIKRSCFGTTTDEALFLVHRVDKSTVKVFAVGQAFSDNCINEIFLHSACVARDQSDDVSITLFLQDDCGDLPSKLIVLSTFNIMIHEDPSATPLRIENLIPPQNVDVDYLQSV
uniref:Uncharacterized protein n=1 Tax=Panagrolaimus superbus TaxID=310955 RepID=A0A914Y6A7_9BILA